MKIKIFKNTIYNELIYIQNRLYDNNYIILFFSSIIQLTKGEIPNKIIFSKIKIKKMNDL